MHGVKNLANPIFNLVLGVSPATIGIIMAAARLWDAFTDPVMGGITDNARTKWGRRRPFIAAGAIAAGVVFPLWWWMPPAWDEGARHLWLWVTSFAFYTAFTVFSVPYHALGYELAPNYADKTRLLGVRTIFTTITGLGVGWIFALTQSGWLGTPQESVRVLAIAIGVIIAATGLLPALFVREIAAPELQRQAKTPLIQALKIALPSRPFWILIGAATCTILGLNMVNVLGLYVGVYYVFGGDMKSATIVGGFGHTLHCVCVIVSTPLIVKLASRVGKRNALLGCLGLALVASFAKWWLFTPAHPWWQLGVTALMAPPLAGLWMLSESMVADVSEYESLRTHVRLEGVFGALYAWTLKTGLTLGVFLSGLIVVGSGFDVAKAGGQSPETLFWLRFLFAAVPAVAITVAIILLRRFPLGAVEMADVRRQLEERKRRAAET
jgi:GPH family glycoside/pentoside/hexuronide:cation symporter